MGSVLGRARPAELRLRDDNDPRGFSVFEPELDARAFLDGR
jgi:hypothetical protein